MVEMDHFFPEISTCPMDPRDMVQSKIAEEFLEKYHDDLQNMRPRSRRAIVIHMCTDFFIPPVHMYGYSVVSSGSPRQNGGKDSRQEISFTRRVLHNILLSLRMTVVL